MKSDFEQHLKQIENKYQEKLQRLKEDLDLRLKVEIHEVEERKNKHRNELMNNHEKAFRDIKKYYNDITRGNLELIRSLKEEKVQLTKNEKENEKLIQELEEQNKVLKSPVEAAKKELADLEAQLTNYKLDKVSLQNAKKFLKNLAHKLEESKYDKRELETKYRQIVSERDELFQKFEITISKVREKTEYKNAYLEQKLQSLEDSLMRKETQLQEVLRRADLDPRYFVDISKKIVDSLEAKNTIIKNLQYSLAHATKAYNDAIRVYEAKLVEFGIPAEELGFQPLEGNNSTMPAGLVAA
jgi:chromosome segregation ATPase